MARAINLSGALASRGFELAAFAFWQMFGKTPRHPQVRGQTRTRSLRSDMARTQRPLQSFAMLLKESRWSTSKFDADQMSSAASRIISTSFACLPPIAQHQLRHLHTQSKVVSWIAYLFQFFSPELHFWALIQEIDQRPVLNLRPST